MFTDEELIDRAHDLYKKLGGAGSPDARLVRGLWERWQEHRTPGPATLALLELVKERFLLMDAHSHHPEDEIVVLVPMKLARQVLTEWEPTPPDH